MNDFVKRKLLWMALGNGRHLVSASEIAIRDQHPSFWFNRVLLRRFFLISPDALIFSLLPMGILNPQALVFFNPQE